MHRPALFVALLAACTLFSSPTLFASDAPEPSAQATLEQMRTRLNLTADQEAKIAPLAEQRRVKMEEVRSKVNAATSRRDKGAAMREAKSAQDEYVRSVEPILTSEQQAEWKKIRDEGKQQLKERWRERQN